MKLTLENGLSGEMGGGTYTYLMLPGSCHLVQLYYLTCLVDQVASGSVDIKYIDETVKTVLRTKFALRLFESMFD